MLLEGEQDGDLHFFLPAPPGFNVVRLSDSKGSTSVDESPVRITMSGSYDPLFVSTQTIGSRGGEKGDIQFLVLLWSRGFGSCYESSTNPNGLSTVHEHSG
jgi:hypothetical protein